MARKAPVILGLDLSTRAAAGVAIPIDWKGDWSRVRTIVFGIELSGDYNLLDTERALRTEKVSAQLVNFARANGCKRAQIESYALNKRTAAHTLGELGGVVRLELVRAGIEIHTSNMSTSRKLLLGKLPRNSKDTPREDRVDVKKIVHETLLAAGAPWTSKDLTDAFVAANLHLAEIGAYAFAQAA